MGFGLNFTPGLKKYFVFFTAPCSHTRVSQSTLSIYILQGLVHSELGDDLVKLAWLIA